MTFSDTVAQQREHQENRLRQFLVYSITGSLVLHGIVLFSRVNPFGQLNDLASEEITIVVTEPVFEEEPEAPIPVENDFVDAPVDAPDSGGFSDPGGAPNAASSLEAPSADVALSEEEPEPEPSPLPVAEENENALAEPVAETSETRDLSSLLEDLRRARQQFRDGRVGAVGHGSGDPIDTVGTGHGTGTGLGTGTEPETETETGTETGLGDRPRRGGSSREITCRGCDFDYPDSAEGAEGTAQVIVETDAQGRVVSVTLSRSSGNAALDRAALEQARRRVRLNNARAGESYPIDVDFVQPDSEAAQQVRERGDRRSITVSDPVESPPTAEASTPTPPSSAPQSPPPQLAPPTEPSASSELSPSSLPSPEQPSGTAAADPVDSQPVSPEAPTLPAPAPAPDPAPAPIEP